MSGRSQACVLFVGFAAACGGTTRTFGEGGAPNDGRDAATARDSANPDAVSLGSDGSAEADAGAASHVPMGGAGSDGPDSAYAGKNEGGAGGAAGADAAGPEPAHAGGNRDSAVDAEIVMDGSVGESSQDAAGGNPDATQTNPDPTRDASPDSTPSDGATGVPDPCAAHPCPSNGQCVGEADGGYRCRKPNGGSCSSGSECVSTLCVEGVCCSSACKEACFSCTVSGHVGACTGVPTGADPTGKCGACHTCSAAHQCLALDGVAAPSGQCVDSNECGDSGRCIHGVCEKRPKNLACGMVMCEEGDAGAPRFTTGRCDGAGNCASQLGSCNGYHCLDSTACKAQCSGDGDCAKGYHCDTASGICTRWVSVGTSTSWSDLVSSGSVIYRVGGTSIHAYDPNSRGWTLVTLQNPNTYAHGSPGEHSRVWYNEGRIISYTTNSPSITVYDLSAATWSTYALPVAQSFAYGGAGVLDRSAGTLFVQWSEPAFDLATARFQLTSRTWGTVAQHALFSTAGIAIDDRSGRYLFDLAFPIDSSGRYLQLRIYDFATQPHDLSGTWRLSSLFDAGPGRVAVAPDYNYGAYVLAWDDVVQNVYAVDVNFGKSTAYHLATDEWEELDQRPGGIYRGGGLAIANGWLYSAECADAGGACLWAIALSNWR